VASIHAQKNRPGNAYRVLWRQDGRQRSLTFENLPAAERFKTLLEDHGPDEALRVIKLDEIGRHVPTVTEWLTTHIDNLTGVQPATPNRLDARNGDFRRRLPSHPERACKLRGRRKAMESPGPRIPRYSAGELHHP
jgi:hypothetical protein